MDVSACGDMSPFSASPPPRIPKNQERHRSEGILEGILAITENNSQVPPQKIRTPRKAKGPV